MSLATLQELHEIDQNALRKECDDLRRRMEVSRNTFAREIGVPPSTFSEWRDGTYKGNTDAVALKVKRGVEALKDKTTARATQPKRAPFLLTPTAQTIEQSLAMAHYMPCVTVIGGAPGVGKTVTCEQYQAQKPHVYMFTNEPSTRTIAGVLEMVAYALGVPSMPVNKQSRAIIEFLRGKDALLISDETQHLETRALEQLRSIRDKANCGLALAGNMTVHRRLEGHGRSVSFAQLFSRVFGSVNIAGASKSDALELIGWYGIEDKQVVSYLVSIAKKAGGLRVLTATLLQAQMLAGGDEVTLEHVRTGYGRLSATLVQNS